MLLQLPLLPRYYLVKTQYDSKVRAITYSQVPESWAIYQGAAPLFLRVRVLLGLMSLKAVKTRECGP